MDTDRRLRLAMAGFLAVYLFHTADHLRRGMDVVSVPVQVLGNTQIVLAVVTAVLVFRSHHLASRFAFALGALSASGFSIVHLLPHWSSVSDSYCSAPASHRVTAMSWVSAIGEIGGGIVLAVVAALVIREERRGLGHA